MYDESKIVIVTLVVLCIIFLAIILFAGVMGINDSKAPGVENTTCEHEFVVSSEYDFWMRSYRTFSKCHKCGKEI